MVKRITNREIPGCVARREAFRAHSVTGEVRPVYVGSGRLNATDTTTLYEDQYGGKRLAYVVYSYATPIAWVTAEGTVRLVHERFSVTTSNHQRHVAVGFHQSPDSAYIRHMDERPRRVHTGTSARSPFGGISGDWHAPQRPIGARYLEMSNHNTGDTYGYDRARDRAELASAERARPLSSCPSNASSPDTSVAYFLDEIDRVLAEGE